MFDAPMDGFVLWTGLAAISLVVLGVALGLSSGLAPPAAGVADAVDRVATSPYGATGTVAVDADEIRLGSSQVSLRNGDRTSHATFVAGSVTPVGDGRLRRVLSGVPVRDVFDSKRAFRRALERYPARPIEWREAPDRLRVRRVSWGEVHATLVG